MTYWHYTYENVNGNVINYGWGVMICDSEDFDFLSVHSQSPERVILSVTQISEEQFNELEKHIRDVNKKKEKEL